MAEERVREISGSHRRSQSPLSREPLPLLFMKKQDEKGDEHPDRGAGSQTSHRDLQPKRRAADPSDDRDRRTLGASPASRDRPAPEMGRKQASQTRGKPYQTECPGLRSVA